MLSRITALLAAVVLAVALLAVVFTACQPADYLMKDLVIDDAIYFLKPAQNFVAGHGFSLDGRHLTNGVQPLWAIVVTGIAFLTDDTLAAIRAMVLLSGGLWAAGGWLLYRLLRSLHPLSGLLAMLVWLMAGFELLPRFCMMGMENGLNGFVLMLTMLQAHRLATTPADAPQWHGRALLFGATAALLALTRVENGLLAVLFAVWIAIRQRRGEGWWRGIPRTWSFVVPLALVGGGWLGFSRWYFGEWLPISGTLKAWQSRDGTMPMLEALQNRALQAVVLSLTGVVLMLHEHVLPRLVRWLERMPTSWELAAVLSPCLLPLLLRMPGWRPSRLPPSAPIYVVLVVFVAAHLLLMAWLLLDSYVKYSSWYFVPEIALVCLLVGGIAGRLRAWWQWLLVLPLATVVIGSAVVRVPTWFQATPNGVTTPYVDLGRWLEPWLPPGSTVGTLASGYVAIEAKSHTVINLDGLINDGRYVREYMMQGRVPDYFRDEGIRYFADNLPVTQWRDYQTPEAKMLPPGMRPLHCWPTAKEQVAAVLATADTATAPAHPLGALFFRTLALGENRTIADAERATLPADQQIVASYLDAPAHELRHVVVPRAAAPAGVDGAGVEHLGMLRLDFGEAVQLAGFESVPNMATTPGRTLVRVYLRGGAQVAAAGELELVLWIGEAEPAGKPRLELVGPPAHGTLPPGTWQPGQLVAHAFLVELPTGFPSGHHALRFGVRTKGGPWLPGPGEANGSANPRIGTLRVAPR